MIGEKNNKGFCTKFIVLCRLNLNHGLSWNPFVSVNEVYIFEKKQFMNQKEFGESAGEDINLFDFLPLPRKGGILFQF